MKRILTLVFIAMIGALVFSACSRGTGTPIDPAPTPTTYTMTGTVNGKAWSAPCFALPKQNYYGYSYVRIISGDTSVYPYIEINIPLNTDLVGTNLINDSLVMYPGVLSPKYANASIDSSNAQYAEAFYGFLTITQKSPNIVGTFNFTCFDSTKVIGSFTCKTP